MVAKTETRKILYIFYKILLVGENKIKDVGYRVFPASSTIMNMLIQILVLNYL